MLWDSLFGLTNLWALVGWAAIAFLPRRPFVISFAMYGVVAMLCVAYGLAMTILLTGGADPQPVPGAGQAGFTTLDGIMALFDSRAGAMIGWAHYLALDLFCGIWIASDADRKGIGRLWQLPILVLTLVAAPVGLLLYLAVREPAARRAARPKASGPRG